MAMQNQQRCGQTLLSPLLVPVSRTGSYLLVLVDMQTGFPAACNELLQVRAGRLIEHAWARTWPIGGLSVSGRGKTVPRIAAALADYELVEFIEKQTTSGSAKVLEACQKRAFSTGKFLVCGVNTGACVLETVRGLAFSPGHPMVATLMDACGDEVAGDWYEFPEASNVSLIPSLDLL